MDIIDLTEMDIAPRSSQPTIKLQPASSQLRLVATANADSSSFVNLLSDDDDNDERKSTGRKRKKHLGDPSGGRGQRGEGEIVDEIYHRANDKTDSSRRSRRKRNKSPALFFIDDQPANIIEEGSHLSASAPDSKLAEVSDENTENAPLLLPNHVTLDSKTNEVKFIDEITTLLGVEDDSIYFADLEDTRNVCVQLSTIGVSLTFCKI